MGYICSICKEGISENVYKYSMAHFNKPLCLMHQKNVPSVRTYYCNECRKPISYGEFKYSLRNFDKPLCRDCQPEIEEKISAPPRKFRGTYKIEFGGQFPKDGKKNEEY